MLEEELGHMIDRQYTFRILFRIQHAEHVFQFPLFNLSEIVYLVLDPLFIQQLFELHRRVMYHIFLARHLVRRREFAFVDDVFKRQIVLVFRFFDPALSEDAGAQNFRQTDVVVQHTAR